MKESPTSLAPVLAALLVWAGSAAGILLIRSGSPAAHVVSVAAAVATAGAVCAVRRSTTTSRSRLRALPVVGAAALLGVAALGGAVRADLVHAGPAATLAGAGSAPGRGGPAATLQGRVVVEPRMAQHGAWTVLRLEWLQPAARDRTRSGERVLLRLGAEARPPPFAATVRATGVLSAVPDGDFARWLAAQGTVVQIRGVQMAPVRDPPGWIAATTWLRERLRRAVDPVLSDTQAPLLRGLVTGDVEGQQREVGDHFADAGLTHLVAVSGSNVAVVLAGVAGLLGAVGAGRRGVRWCCLGVLWWFVVLVRVEPSVVRAAAMATLVLVAGQIGRPVHGVHVLSTAVATALLVDPFLSLRAGFVLSVCACAGVVVLAGPLAERLRGPPPLRAVLAATLGAQIAVLPALLLLGGNVSAASVPANVIAVPAAAVAGAVGNATALVAMLSPDLAGLMARAAAPALDAVLWTARTFAGPARHASDVGAVVAAVVTVATLAWRRCGPVPVVSLAAPIAVVAFLAVGPWPGRTAVGAAPSMAHLVALDVGQGDALLLGDPMGGWLLLDGGPDPESLLAALRRRGVGRLRAVVVSHPHDDHTAGLVGVLEAMDVGMVFRGPWPHGTTEASPSTTALIAAAHHRGVPVSVVSAGDALRLGSLRLEVLSPPATGLGVGVNDASLVLRVEHPGGRSALLTGDIEASAQAVLMARDAPLDVDVLKVPHHGGDTNTDGFLAATTPEVAVISAGEGNPFGHPHSDVLADLAGVEVRRTDRDGDVVVPLD